ncbi:MAG: glycosyltransferase [Methylotenera sp.]|nr:glycosyltransferase [Methylotenera sp.]
METAEARELLGIPQDGFYIGFVGMMDYRKAVPELLAAFASAKIYLTSRLLLAGKLAQEYQQLIEEKYADLIKSQRIILINRHLTNQEVQIGYAAIDVQALLQYRRMNLSANLLKAVAYGKPILVDRYGYTGMMADRFGIGSTCDVDNLDSIAQGLKSLIENANEFKPTTQTIRLIQFHHVDNYANTIMSELLNNRAQQLDLHSWDWVCEGIVK